MTGSNNNSDLDSIIIPQGDPVIIAGKVLNRQIYPNIKEITLKIPDFKGYKNIFTSKTSGPASGFYEA